MHNDIPRELSFCNQRTSAARGTEIWENFQPSRAPARQGRADHATGLLIFCRTVESLNMSIHKQLLASTSRTCLLLVTLIAVSVCTCTRSTQQLNLQHCIHLCSWAKYTIYFKTYGVSALSEIYLSFIFYWVIVYTVYHVTASLLFANSSSLVRDMLPDKQYLG